MTYVQTTSYIVIICTKQNIVEKPKYLYVECSHGRSEILRILQSLNFSESF